MKSLCAWNILRVEVCASGSFQSSSSGSFSHQDNFAKWVGKFIEWKKSREIFSDGKIYSRKVSAAATLINIHDQQPTSLQSLTSRVLQKYWRSEKETFDSGLLKNWNDSTSFKFVWKFQPAQVVAENSSDKKLCKIKNHLSIFLRVEVFVRSKLWTFKFVSLWVEVLWSWRVCRVWNFIRQKLTEIYCVTRRKVDRVKVCRSWKLSWVEVFVTIYNLWADNLCELARGEFSSAQSFGEEEVFEIIFSGKVHRQKSFSRIRFIQEKSLCGFPTLINLPRLKHLIEQIRPWKSSAGKVFSSRRRKAFQSKTREIFWISKLRN